MNDGLKHAERQIQKKKDDEKKAKEQRLALEKLKERLMANQALGLMSGLNQDSTQSPYTPDPQPISDGFLASDRDTDVDMSQTVTIAAMESHNTDEWYFTFTGNRVAHQLEASFPTGFDLINTAEQELTEMQAVVLSLKNQYPDCVRTTVLALENERELCRNLLNRLHARPARDDTPLFIIQLTAILFRWGHRAMKMDLQLVVYRSQTQQSVCSQIPTQPGRETKLLWILFDGYHWYGMRRKPCQRNDVSSTATVSLNTSATDRQNELLSDVPNGHSGATNDVSGDPILNEPISKY